MAFSLSGWRVNVGTLSFSRAGSISICIASGSSNRALIDTAEKKK
jgi:hypothetical protein